MVRWNCDTRGRRRTNCRSPRTQTVRYVGRVTCSLLEQTDVLWWCCVPGEYDSISIFKQARGRAHGAPEQCQGVRWYPDPSAWGLVCEAPPPGPPKSRLLDQVREEIRRRHYSRRAEKSYVDGWIRRFILFHGKRHPAEMGEAGRYGRILAVELDAQGGSAPPVYIRFAGWASRHICLAGQIGLVELEAFQPDRRPPCQLFRKVCILYVRPRWSAAPFV